MTNLVPETRDVARISSDMQLKRLVLIGKMQLIENLTSMISENTISLDTTVSELIEIVNKEIHDIKTV